MGTADVNGITIRYDEQGSGEPVLLIHGGLFVDTFRGFFSEPSLAGYRLIAYDRRGLGGSTRGATLSTMNDQATDATSLLDHLGIDRAHVVCHSAGGAVGLQLAAQAPERVRSLSLLEPGLPDVLVQEATLGYLAECIGLAQTNPEAAVEQFFTLVIGKGGREVFERNLPGIYEQGIADADVLFTEEANILTTWQFGEADAATITMPVLFVLGTESDAIVRETLPIDIFEPTRDRLVELLPQMEVAVVDGLDHLLQVADPARVAQPVSEFIQRHPLPA